MDSINTVAGLLIDEAGQLRQVLYYPSKEAGESLRKEGGNMKDSGFT